MGGKSIPERGRFLSPPRFFLNSLGATGSLGDASSSRDLQSNPRECRAMQGNTGQCRAIQENAGTHSEKQNNPRECRAAQNRPGDFQENTGSVATARWSFVCQQNCTVCAAGLRPQLDREPRAQHLRLIRIGGHTRREPIGTTSKHLSCSWRFENTRYSTVTRGRRRSACRSTR